MREAYQIIKSNPNMKRLNIEVEFDPANDGREEARRRKYQAVVDSIRWTREELGVGQGSKGQIQSGRQLECLAAVIDYLRRL